jgi:hypothetical protein
MIIKITVFLILLCLTACGDVTKDDLDCIVAGKDCNNNNMTPTPTITPTVKPGSTPRPTPTPKPVTSTNPVCVGVPDSRQHLLWKPVSDTNSNAVLVTDGKYKREFLQMKVELKNGTFQSFQNGNLLLWGNPDKDGPRQHFRFPVKATSVKASALIIADDGLQECRWKLPGDATKRWE